MLVDGGKGLEGQTKKLFGVARRSRLPVFTFVNKLDRPALSPWEVLDEIASEFGLETAVRTFPIGDGERFKGVYAVETDEVWLYERTERGAKAALTKVPYADSAAAIGDDELVAQLAEDREMIQELTPPLDEAALASGAMTSVYFGSAMSDAGVEPFLDEFIQLGSRPAPRPLRVAAGDDPKKLAPDHGDFAGFVFKMQVARAAPDVCWGSPRGSRRRLVAATRQTRNIHVAAAAAPRLVSTEYALVPRRGGDGMIRIVYRRISTRSTATAWRTCASSPARSRKA